MTDHYYDPVGQCIYCGEGTLPEGISRFTDEHIIPLGLGGTLILREASYGRCQRLINKQIETPILRHEWGGLRDRREFPTSNKKDRKERTHLPATNAEGARLMIPIKDHSTPVPIYRFSEARILSSMPAGFPEHHFIVSLLSDTDEEKAMHAKYPAWDKTHRFIARPHIFARMLAKIGYSLAVAEYGKSKTTAFTPLVTDLILGISDDWTYAIGGSWEIPPPVQGGDHITMINLLVRPFDALIIVNIRLFSQIEMPIYHAVVGSISFKNSEHVRAFEQYRAEGKIENIPLKRP